MARFPRLLPLATLLLSPAVGAADPGAPLVTAAGLAEHAAGRVLVELTAGAGGAGVVAFQGAGLESYGFTGADERCALGSCTGVCVVHANRTLECVHRHAGHERPHVYLRLEADGSFTYLNAHFGTWARGMLGRSP